MSVVFVDAESGEVIPTDDEPVEPSRREKREKGERAVPEKRERSRTPIWPVFVVAALIIGFLVGGGMSSRMYQDEIHNLKVELGYPDVP